MWTTSLNNGMVLNQVDLFTALVLNKKIVEQVIAGGDTTVPIVDGFTYDDANLNVKENVKPEE